MSVIGTACGAGVSGGYVGVLSAINPVTDDAVEHAVVP